MSIAVVPTITAEAYQIPTRKNPVDEMVSFFEASGITPAQIAATETFPIQLAPNSLPAVNQQARSALEGIKTVLSTGEKPVLNGANSVISIVEDASSSDLLVVDGNIINETDDPVTISSKLRAIAQDALIFRLIKETLAESMSRTWAELHSALRKRIIEELIVSAEDPMPYDTAHDPSKVTIASVYDLQTRLADIKNNAPKINY